MSFFARVLAPKMKILSFRRFFAIVNPIINFIAPALAKMKSYETKKKIRVKVTHGRKPVVEVEEPHLVKF